MWHVQGATEGWAAARDWVAADGGLDLDFLEQQFGAAQVLVTDTARQGGGGLFWCWLTADVQWLFRLPHGRPFLLLASCKQCS